MRKPTWKKADAKKAIEAIADAIADHFKVARPDVTLSTYDSWEWCVERTKVWTKAGPAELAIDIDSGFGHMYFRFDDPQRAIPFDSFGRLNRHSGKWNSLETARHDLSEWCETLKRDFALVAEPNPDPAEKSEYEAREAADAERWRVMREEFAARESRP